MKNLSPLLLLLLLASCSENTGKPVAASPAYFDLKGYFKNEAFRLQKLNPTVRKQVGINGSAESKALKVGNWAKEFANFTDADINKTSWKGSFKVQKSGNQETFTSNDKKIPVKRLTIEKAANQVRKIEVVLAVRNLIYHSNDTLRYYPDSLYEISKQQKIKLLNSKSYRVSGFFK